MRNMKKNNELLQFCRYYKGEDKCPFDDKRCRWWEYEKKWVEFTTSVYQTNQSNYILDISIEEYISNNMQDFEKSDGVPLSLKALLYNRYYYWNQGGDFKKWYLNEYKKER